MKREEVHRLWAPDDATWSAWVKPVLFAYLVEDPEPKALPSPPSWIEARIVAPIHAHAQAAPGGEHTYRSAPRRQDTAVILDLPGAAGVRVGAALGRHGFRPVPLYNAIPAPEGVIAYAETMQSLVDAASSLSGLAQDAPPAFLLDQRRMGKGVLLEPGKYDNRSFVFPNDFPSVKTLARAGIRRAALVQREADHPAADLAPILRSWQEQGIEILHVRTDVNGPAEVLRVARPGLFESVGQWFDRMGLRRRRDGTFGGVIPERSSGG
ncbi:hypothetical protein [Polyangium jinanense]|uniref:Uncharacterized protein n=1 Tax=Polyangium jinanense TaxID=2829994 RepID=A0A9X4AY99_9BACT|nr:hypothetical protein [Polyangium jinanense]MDC3961376.1 hypothetical protein [Polyangium jinanense]MDC3986977.1 hypothetical protein [Polyangium jinanense]